MSLACLRESLFSSSFLACSAQCYRVKGREARVGIDGMRCGVGFGRVFVVHRDHTRRFGVCVSLFIQNA